MYYSFITFYLLQLLLLISAAHGDWETVSALLQDKTKDVNLNCLNEVRDVCMCESTCAYISHCHVYIGNHEIR